MAPKPQPLILAKEDFRVYLFAQMHLKKVTPTQYAEELGIDLSHFYSILAGTQEPSEELADKVGLRPAWVLKETPNHPDPKPPKKKRS